MANIQISSLPAFTGSPTEIKWFVANNSGNTTTYKMSGYTAGLVPGTGTDSLKSSLTSTQGIASGTESIAIGNDARATGTYNIAIGSNTDAIVGNGSIALGWSSSVGDSGIAIGGGHTSPGLATTTIGYGSNNQGNYSIALGTQQDIKSSANNSISIGSNGYINTSANNSIAIGQVGNTNAPYQYSMGYNNGAGNGQRIFNFAWDSNAFLNGNYSIGIGQNFNQGGNYHTLIGHGNGNQGGTDMIQIGRDIQSSASTTNIIGIGENLDVNAEGTIVMGQDISVLTPYSVYLGGVSNTNSMTSSSYHNTILNGSGNTYSSNASGNFVINSFDGGITDDNFSGILGGKQNTIANSNNDGMNFIIGGYKSTINGLGRNNVILGGENLDGSGGCNWSFLLAGQNNQINGGNGGGVIGSDNSQYRSGNNGVVISSNSSIIGNGGGANYASIIGSANASLDGGNRNVVMATENNSFQNNSQSILAGGYGHNLTNNNDSGAFAGRQNIINSANQSATIGGISSTIPGLDNVVMAATSGRTALYPLTLHTDNHHTYKTETFDVVSGGSVSGNVVVDCSLATIYTFTLSGNITQIDFQGLRAGQRLEFIVENTTYNFTGSALINGVSGYVYSKNGTISPQNNSITHYTATYDGTRLFLDEETGFSVV